MQFSFTKMHGCAMDGILVDRRGPLLDTLVEAGGEACRVSCVGVGGAHCVWRYGMGEVPACSECAGAAVTAAVLTDRVRRGADIVVEMPGGELTVRYDGRALFVTGEAVRVFSGEITIGDA